MVADTSDNAELRKIAGKASIIWDVVKLIEADPNVSYRLLSGRETDSPNILEQAKATLKNSMQLYLVSEGLGGFVAYEGSDKPAYIATIDPIENTADFIEPHGEFQVLQKDGTRIPIESCKVHEIYASVLDDFRRGFGGIVLENGVLHEFPENHGV